jgi:hypothetical protein
MVNSEKMKIDLPGIDNKMREQITQRVEEFELKHEPNIVNDGDGWIPRVKNIDYIIAITLNIFIVLWLIIALS